MDQYFYYHKYIADEKVYEDLDLALLHHPKYKIVAVPFRVMCKECGCTEELADEFLFPLDDIKPSHYPTCEWNNRTKNAKLYDLCPKN